MAVTNADILGWLNANPGADAALINQTMAEAGVSAAQYQDATGASLPEAAPTTITELYQQVLGRPPESAAVIADWQNQFGSTIEPNEIAQFEKVAQLEKTNPAAATLKGQILGQNTTDKWTGQGYGSAEANAEAMAKLLADAGITDIKQFGKLESGGFGNKVTGEEINRGSGRWERQGGENLFSGTGEGKGNTAFRAEFAPDGTPIFYTTQGSSSDVSKGLMTALSLAAGYFAPGVGNALLGAGANQIAAGALGGSLLGGGLAAATGQDVLKGALTGGIGGAGSAYLGNAFGDTAAGFGPQTDASFLAADAAQLAKQGISQSQIVDILSSSGYGSTAAANLAASMAVNGLDVGAMTDQLNNLSSNTGLMSQTGSSADFLAADALQLQGQVGNNFAAIEQNLIASGVDPLIAADVSQQLAFNPGLTQAQLATNLSNSFGNNIYDVNMAATYPTSVLPGSGGLLSDVAGVGGANTSTGAVTSTGSGASTAATGSGSGLTTSQIANLATAGLNVAGLLGVTSALSGGTGGSRSVGALPTQGVPLNTADYFNAIQQNYNRLLPAVPRDVATPLAQWYNSQYGA
jgi:hypothetical protein